MLLCDYFPVAKGIIWLLFMQIEGFHVDNEHDVQGLGI